ASVNVDGGQVRPLPGDRRHVAGAVLHLHDEVVPGQGVRDGNLERARRGWRDDQLRGRGAGAAEPHDYDPRDAGRVGRGDRDAYRAATDRLQVGVRDGGRSYIVVRAAQQLERQVAVRPLDATH